VEDVRWDRRTGALEEGSPVGSRSDQYASPVLLRSLREGSSSAWGRLYDEFAPGLRRFAATSLSGDIETAEDVVVETLARAARHIRQYLPGKASLSTWLYGIARQRVHEELRWRRRRKSIPAWAQVSFEDVPQAGSGEDLAARTAARMDAQTRLAEITSLLSDTETELLTLSTIDELPVREIGRVVGCSEQAAHSALHRARHKARRTAIEGTLLIGATHRPRTEGGFYPYSHLFSGLEDRLAGDEFGISCEFSPTSDEIAYFLHCPGLQDYPPASGHIWKAKRDGSDAVNLSEAAGLKGINFYPRWSPDGTMISFLHWDVPGAELSGPGEAWVMKADGSEARRAAPGVSSTAWSPDGSCLLCGRGDSSAHALPASMDLWGRRVRLAPDLGGAMDWSPDGTRVAVTRTERGHMEGEPGYWSQLLVMAADGSAPRVLVEQFIADAVVDACPSAPELGEYATTYDWKADLRWWAGPQDPRWSPTGDKIAFLAELPFDPDGPHNGLQVDAWIYDLVTRRLTKLTNEPHLQHSLTWR
jgi:RNA polymerase sigma factor (sigma-70 family)